MNNFNSIVCLFKTMISLHCPYYFKQMNDQQNQNFSFNLDLELNYDIPSLDLCLNDTITFVDDLENSIFNPEPLISDQLQSQESFFGVNQNAYYYYLISLQSQKKKIRKRRGDGEESQKRDPNDSFNYKNKPCYYFASMVSTKVYRKKCTSKILSLIANAVELLNPKIPRRSRMEKRRKTVCFAWFHRNWEQISKMKNRIIEYLMKS